jgi:hypothetical protein
MQARVFFSKAAFMKADWEQRTGLMRRFKSNQWWILILAIVLSVAGVAFLPAAGFADKGTDGTIGSDPGDSTNPPDPGGVGDPDSPSGSGKSSVQSGGGEFYGTTGEPGVGDAGAKRLAPFWMKARIALGVLKYYYLRF